MQAAMCYTYDVLYRYINTKCKNLRCLPALACGET